MPFVAATPTITVTTHRYIMHFHATQASKILTFAHFLIISTLCLLMLGVVQSQSAKFTSVVTVDVSMSAETEGKRHFPMPFLVKAQL